MNALILHQKLPTQWRERERLRDKGQFWTPSWVAEAMLAYVADGADVIFDPATGRGAFLDALIKLRKNISFFGTDVDPIVLEDDIYARRGCYTEVRDFIKEPPERTFKAIVANPPYIRHHRLDEHTKIFLKRLCADITGFTIDGRAGYHVYFLLQALNHLDVNGKLAFIMPADTCEGIFAKKLWQWIAANFCIECVVTFDEQATPFPKVDTNAVVFLIKKSRPQKFFHWVKATQAYTGDLYDFIASGFKKAHAASIEVTRRELDEALRTGLSRPEQKNHDYKYRLNDFAVVVRGIATGANEFFFMTAAQAKERGISAKFLKRAIGKTRDVTGDCITTEDMKSLEEKDRPTLLFAINGETNLPEKVLDYLKTGEEAGYQKRPLIKQRHPWYKMENRRIPPLLFAYLGRRNARFIKNEAGVVPLTNFLCVYPIYKDEEYVTNLWRALNHPNTLKNLWLVGKSYGSGAIKVEPRGLSNLPIPDHVVNQFHIKRQYVSPLGQLNIFREPKKLYGKQ